MAIKINKDIQISDTGVSLNNLIPKTTQTSSNTNTYSCNYMNNITNYNYSTTEVKTGATWIDGKPIYRKVVDYNGTLATGGTSVPHHTSNFKQIVTARIIAKYNATQWYMGGAMESGTVFVTVNWVNGSYINIRTGSGWNGSFSGAYIIMEYTKTTD